MDLWWFSTTDKELVEGGIWGQEVRGQWEGSNRGVCRGFEGRGGGLKSFTPGQKNLIENKLSVKEKRA